MLCRIDIIQSKVYRRWPYKHRGFTDEEKRMDAIFLDGYLRGRQWTMNEALAKRVEIMELHGDIIAVLHSVH